MKEHMKPAIKVFSNPYLERLTHTPVSWVITIFILLFGFTLYRSLHLGAAALISLFICGFLLWTLTEYSIHRFIFHHPLFPKVFPRFYAIIHGIHHDTPLDRNRLLVPLYVSLPLGSLVYVMFHALIPVYADALFSGFILGYMSYDLTHYSIHHFQPKTRLGKALRAYHFKHHFKDNRRNFGVSSPLWDLLLGSNLRMS